ncbi:hypothetical protein B0O80DRAFT_485308 [Mortierella sp. GBAus27b]|nr:hypothetical protein B0O80DRAFT_485308 [Mortierella sp. GBAus27b]
MRFLAVIITLVLVAVAAAEDFEYTNCHRGFPWLSNDNHLRSSPAQCSSQFQETPSSGKQGQVQYRVKLTGYGSARPKTKRDISAYKSPDLDECSELDEHSNIQQTAFKGLRISDHESSVMGPFVLKGRILQDGITTNSFAHPALRVRIMTIVNTAPHEQPLQARLHSIGFVAPCS